MSRKVYIAGATGYLGAALASHLVERGHTVRALARAGSERKLPPGCEVQTGDALKASTIECSGCSTYVHLVGTPHPAPWKGAQFRAIDAVSLRASVDASTRGGIEHFVYVSVAHPAPVMKEYIAVRSACEEYLRKSELRATILRPWYVLGPGHWWPVAILPVYKLLEAVPSTREGAMRLGLVTHAEMIGALRWAVENSPAAVRVVETPEIRRLGASSRARSSGI